MEEPKTKLTVPENKLFVNGIVKNNSPVLILLTPFRDIILPENNIIVMKPG